MEFLKLKLDNTSPCESDQPKCGPTAAETNNNFSRLLHFKLQVVSTLYSKRLRNAVPKSSGQYCQTRYRSLLVLDLRANLTRTLILIMVPETQLVSELETQRALLDGNPPTLTSTHYESFRDK
jgi:hypothetical protein